MGDPASSREPLVQVLQVLVRMAMRNGRISSVMAVLLGRVSFAMNRNARFGIGQNRSYF